MATTDKIASPDQLSKDDRFLVCTALTMYRTSKLRAAKASADDQELAKIHQRRIEDIDALIIKFR